MIRRNDTTTDSGQIPEYARTMSCSDADGSWRMTMPESFRGLEAGTELLPSGILLGYYDFMPQEDIKYDFNVNGSAVQFGGVISGSVQVTESGEHHDEGVVLGASRETVFRIRGFAGQGRLNAGRRIQMFAVVLSVEQLSELLMGLGEYERFLEATTPATTGFDLLSQKPLSPTYAMLISQLRQCTLQGGFRRLYMEGMVLEILALQLDGLTRKTQAQTSLSRADIDRLHAARELLLQRMDDPPGLKELASHACINEFKLKKGFKELFGTTVFGMLREYRMEAARAMFLDSDMTVSTVATAVGYTNMSHFIATFRQRYGVTPGILAKQSRRSHRCPEDSAVRS